MTARARAFAVVGAYLCLLTQAVGLLHVLVVRHATCPDHGELVHGRPHVVARAPEAGVVTQAAVSEAPPAATEEGDDHCLFVATRRREMAGLTAAPAVTAILVEDASAALVDLPVSVHAPRALLHLAPKTSPPIHAG